ncbi:MAG: sensor histidine kinase [Bacteroidetes bacterium]|nr:sensor histidine kinase [Bacteroidota bacterium]
MKFTKLGNFQTKLLLFVFVLSFFSTSVNAQKTKKVSTAELAKSLMDSVKSFSFYDSTKMFAYGDQLIKVSKKYGFRTPEIEVTIVYGNFYYYRAQFLKALVFYKKALSISESIRDNHFKALSLIKIAYVKSALSDFEVSRKIFSAVYLFSKERLDTLPQIEALNGIGILSESFNNIEKAISSYKLAIALAEKARLYYEYGYVKNNIGLLYFNLEEDSLAYLNFTDAIKCADISKSKKLKAHTNLNMGLYYKKIGDIASAEKNYRLSLRQSEIDHSPIDLIATMTNLAEIAKIKNEKQHAEALYDSAMTICFKAGLEEYYSLMYYGKAESKELLNDIPAAIHFTNLGLEWAVKRKNASSEQQGYSLLSKYYEKINDHKSALIYFKKNTAIADSLNNENYVSKIKYLNSQEEILEKNQSFEKEKNKNLLLEKDFEKAREGKNRIVTVFIFIVLIVIASFVFSYEKLKRKNLKKHRKIVLELTDKERSNIARDLHDEVGQILSILKNKQSKLNVINENDKIELIQLLDDAIDKTRSISLRFHPKFLEHIEINQAISFLLTELEKNTGIVCIFENVDSFNSLSLIDRIHVYRIIQECASNTIKHANATSIRVDFVKSDDKYQITYQDNGKGLSKDFKKRFGLMSIEERVDALNGKLTINTKKSNSFYLEIHFPC